MNAELLEFVENVTSWHAKKVGQLRDIQNHVEEGTKLKVGSDNEEVATMTKRDAFFFGAGMEAVLVELGTLPFTVNFNEPDESEGDEDE